MQNQLDMISRFDDGAEGFPIRGEQTPHLGNPAPGEMPDERDHGGVIPYFLNR